MTAGHPIALGPCLLWTGPRFPGGYGRITRRKDLRRYGTPLAHRAAWIDAHGPIPDGLCIAHHCDQPACIRLDHLFTATHAENMRDKVAKGRARGGRPLSESCGRGHPFTEENTYTDPSGIRHCRTCMRAGDARLRSAPADERATRTHTATGRTRSAHCSAGHDFTAENTYLTPTGGRRCRSCERERGARRRTTSTLVAANAPSDRDAPHIAPTSGT